MEKNNKLLLFSLGKKEGKKLIKYSYFLSRFARVTDRGK